MEWWEVIDLEEKEFDAAIDLANILYKDGILNDDCYQLIDNLIEETVFYKILIYPTMVSRSLLSVSLDSIIGKILYQSIRP